MSFWIGFQSDCWPVPGSEGGALAAADFISAINRKPALLPAVFSAHLLVFHPSYAINIIAKIFMRALHDQ
jgi:hypothetical protein